MQFARIGHRLAGELKDDVAALQAGLGCRRIGLNLRDQHSFVDLGLELLGQRLGHRLNHHAQIGPVDLAVLNQFSADPFGEIDGNGEADALIAAGTAGNRRVDADDLAVEVHQRAAAVAGIDGGVGLNEVFTIGDAEAASLGADDAGRDRAFQSEGLAEGQDPIADFHLAAIAEPGGRKRARPLDAQHGQIGFRIGLDVGGLEFPSVVQADHDLAASGHDVVVRQDDPAGVNDHPGTGPHDAVPWHLGRRKRRKFLEEVAEFRILEQVAERRALEAKRHLRPVVAGRGLSAPRIAGPLPAC